MSAITAKAQVSTRVHVCALMKQKFKSQVTRKVNNLDKVRSRYSLRVARQKFKRNVNVVTLTVLGKHITKSVTQ